MRGPGNGDLMEQAQDNPEGRGSTKLEGGQKLTSPVRMVRRPSYGDEVCEGNGLDGLLDQRTGHEALLTLASVER